MIKTYEEVNIYTELFSSPLRILTVAGQLTSRADGPGISCRERVTIPQRGRGWTHLTPGVDFGSSMTSIIGPRQASALQGK